MIEIEQLVAYGVGHAEKLSGAQMLSCARERAILRVIEGYGYAVVVYF
ncbi:MAG: hypothetical protein RBR45_00650 [Pseudomonas sp.]|jgi:hypothetical protein|nr:hypothetical protein [Pseudomonas sp.]